MRIGRYLQLVALTILLIAGTAQAVEYSHDVQLGDPVRVTLEDGSIFTGKLAEKTDTKIILSADGKRMVLLRSSVSEIAIMPREGDQVRLTMIDDTINTGKWDGKDTDSIYLQTNGAQLAFLKSQVQLVELVRKSSEDSTYYADLNFRWEPKQPVENQDILFLSKIPHEIDSVAKIEWEFPDNQKRSGIQVVHSFAQDGMYEVCIRVIRKGKVNVHHCNYILVHNDQQTDQPSNNVNSEADTDNSETETEFQEGNSKSETEREDLSSERPAGLGVPLPIPLGLNLSLWFNENAALELGTLLIPRNTALSGRVLYKFFNTKRWDFYFATGVTYLAARAQGITFGESIAFSGELGVEFSLSEHWVIRPSAFINFSTGQALGQQYSGINSGVGLSVFYYF